MNAKIQHTFNKPTITPPPNFKYYFINLQNNKNIFPQTHTNENSLSGLQVIHFLITPLPRDKRP